MLALIAGRGALPGRVAAAQTRPPLICALDGNTPDTLVPDLVFRLETLGSFLLDLGNRGVTEICLCGAIDRPQIDPAQVDAETAPLVPLLAQALARGDDGALRIVMDLLERTGFTVRAAHDIAGGLLQPAGVPTARQPHAGHREDARLGARVLADMGRADQGQACVIRKGGVLATEDARGTDAMLTDLALPDLPPLPAGPLPLDWIAAIADRVHDAPGAGGILFKGPKPDQDRRADLPTIGPATALRAGAAGLDGIVITAGEVIVLDLPLVVQICDALHMFLWVRS